MDPKEATTKFYLFLFFLFLLVHFKLFSKIHHCNSPYGDIGIWGRQLSTELTQSILISIELIGRTVS